MAGFPLDKAGCSRTRMLHPRGCGSNFINSRICGREGYPKSVPFLFLPFPTAALLGGFSVRSSLRPRVLLAAAAALTLTGCGFSGTQTQSTQPSAAADTSQRIVVDNFRAPVANWAVESDAAYILSLSGCLETLTTYNQAEGKVLPSLATEWKQSSPLDWDFSIRQGVKFQDGTDLTAESVVSALNHVLDAKVPARAFNRTMISSVTAVDGQTVRVSTPAENPLVPYRLASVNTGILAPAAYKAEGLDPFGHCTGPFTPVSEKAKQSLTLDRNENYWGGNVQLAGAEVRFITNGPTRAAQVQTGEADISLSIPVASLAALKADKGVSAPGRRFAPHCHNVHEQRPSSAGQC